MSEQEMGRLIRGTVKRAEGNILVIKQVDGTEVTLRVVRSLLPPHLAVLADRYRSARDIPDHAPFRRPTAVELADAVLDLEDNGLLPCGCLANNGGAHRIGCPEHPEGVRRDQS